jgi:hypothetical protein
LVLLEVFFEPAIGGGVLFSVLEAGGVQKAVEEDKLVVFLLGKEELQIYG